MLRVLILIGVLAATVRGENLFSWDRGLEKPFPGQPTNTDRTTTAEFLAHSRGIRQDEDGLVTFQIPRPDERLNYRYVGLGPFPVQPLRRYRLAFTLSKPRAEYSTLFLATFLAGDRVLGCYPILSLPGGQYHGLSLAQDFGTPPGTDRMILWMGMSAMGKGPLRPGDKLVFAAMAIRDAGALDGREPGIIFARDFGDEAPGKPAGLEAGNGDRALDAAIVDADGNRFLRLVKEEGDTPFPHYFVPDVKLNGCWVRWQFKARGQGRIMAGMWFRLPDNSWQYGAGLEVELTDEWQPVSFGRYCIDPAAAGVSAAFHLPSPTGNFEIDDLEMRVIGPEAAE